MKCRNSAFNAQGSRIIIVVVHVEAVKIYVVVVEELREKERGHETQFAAKLVEN
jgi:predicted oxidoreductase (fatty acid repression mutant protein)